MQIPKDSIILAAKKFLDALLANTLTLAKAEELGRFFDAERIRRIQMLREIPYQVRKSKTTDSIRCHKLEYKIYSCLYLLTQYRLLTLSPAEQKTRAAALVQSWRNLLPHVKYNKDHLNLEERILLQTLRITVLAHLAHTLVFAQASPTEILSSALHFCIELQNYQNLLLSEKYATAKDVLTLPRFNRTIELSGNWNVPIASTMRLFLGHIQANEKHYPEADREFLTYFNDNSKKEAEPEPAIYAEKLLQKDSQKMVCDLRREIAKCILNPDSKVIPNAVQQTAYYIGILFFLRLQLAKIIHRRNCTMREEKSHEEEQRIQEECARDGRVYKALHQTLELLLPLSNIYRYFLRTPNVVFPFLSVIESAEMKELQIPENCERHFTFALLADVGTLSREALNQTVGRWTRQVEMGHFPFSKQLLYAYVTEETDTKNFPKSEKRSRVGNPLLVETFEVFETLSGNYKESVKIDKCRHYFYGFAQKLLQIDTDFIVTATFFLLCKKALTFSDKAFTDEIRKILHAYAENESSVEVFPQQEYKEEKPKKPVKTAPKNPIAKNAKKKGGNNKVTPPKPKLPAAKKATAAPPPKPAAVTVTRKKPEFTDVPFEYYPKPLRVKKEVQLVEVPPQPTAQTVVVISDNALRQRAHVARCTTSLAFYLAQCAKRFPRMVRRFETPHEFNCEALDEITGFFNRRATYDTQFKFATPLYGSALLGRNRDFDLMVNAPLEEVKALLETETGFENEIASIKVITGKHPNLRLTFKNNPILRIDISSFPEFPEEELPIPLLRLLVLTQRQLNPEATGILFFQCGTRQFLIDSTYFLATLKQTPYPLRLNPLTDTTPKTVVGITFNLIKFLAKYGDDFKPTQEVLDLFETAKKFFSMAIVYDPFVKSLYNGWTRRSLKRLIEFGLLQILCNPLAVYFHETKAFRHEIRVMDEVHSRQHQLHAEASQAGYETVRLFMVAYYLFPIQRRVQLETLPFKLMPEEIGGIRHYWSFWQQAHARTRKIEKPTAEGAALRKSK